MDTKARTPESIPREFKSLDKMYPHSFSKALQYLQPKKKNRQYKELRINGTLPIDVVSLEQLPKAFRQNVTVQKLGLNVLTSIPSDIYSTTDNKMLVGKALRAGFRQDNVICMSFSRCELEDRRVLEIMCQGFKARSTVFQLDFEHCSPFFMEPIMEASHMKCFSLNIVKAPYEEIPFGSPLNRLFSDVLCYISFRGLVYLPQRFYLAFSRSVSMLPKLVKMDLEKTFVPIRALNRLHASLNSILNSGRLNMLEQLHLGETKLRDKLLFSYFRLLGCDLVGSFLFKVEKNVSTTVLKNVASVVINTKNLKIIHTKNRGFKLQVKRFMDTVPVEGNPTVVLK